MWPLDEQMETFRELPFREQWRVRGYLVRGEAFDDPRMAAATVELAESYERHKRLYMGVMRWLPLLMLVLIGYPALREAIEGNVAMAIVFALIVLFSVGQLLLSPTMRPKKMVRSLKASRRIVASDN
jgi:hypothetical protein